MSSISTASPRALASLVRRASSVGSSGRADGPSSALSPPAGGMSNPSALEEERIQQHIEDVLMAAGEFELGRAPGHFALSDVLPFFNEGAQLLVADSFSRCFESSEPDAWNWNSYLFVLWCAGVVFRYGVLFPLRLASLLVGLVLFFVFFGAVTLLVKDPERRASAQRKAIRFLCSAFVFSWTGVIKYHGVIPRRRPNQVYVANHSSMIDMIVLQQMNTYAVVGQQHTGWVRAVQDHVLSCLGCLWFDRSSAKDRSESAAKIKAYIEREDGNRLLLFPEGTCVNNEYVVQFKKGIFETPDVEICPIAIRYNPIFVDGYWNSRQQSFLAHLVRLMCSWAVVCDVWYLEPVKRLDGETAVEFAKRVQLMVAERAGLKAVDWDGYMKYFRPSRRFVLRRQERFAARFFGGGGSGGSVNGGGGTPLSVKSEDVAVNRLTHRRRVGGNSNDGDTDTNADENKKDKSASKKL